MVAKIGPTIASPLAPNGLFQPPEPTQVGTLPTAFQVNRVVAPCVTVVDDAAKVSVGATTVGDDGVGIGVGAGAGTGIGTDEAGTGVVALPDGLTTVTVTDFVCVPA